MDTNSPQVSMQRKKPTEKALKAREAYKQTRSAEECYSLTFTRSRKVSSEGETTIHTHTTKKKKIKNK